MRRAIELFLAGTSCALCVYITVIVCGQWKVFTEYTRVTSLSSANRNLLSDPVNGTHAYFIPPDVIRLPFDEGTSHTTAEVKLLILTYMRSGSTFIGSFFDQNPSAFYVFEPLYTVEVVFQRHKKRGPMFWDKEDLTARQVSDDAIQGLKATILTSYLNCTLKNMFLPSLNAGFNLMGTKTTRFFRCRRQHPGLLGLLRCLPVLYTLCREAKAVVIKTIRCSMEEALRLMDRDPKVKVIHLVRDPRGTLHSQQRLGKLKGRTVTNFSRAFCQTVHADLVVGDAISDRYPDRILRVRYEDIALNPVAYARKLLGFAGLRLSTQQEKRLHDVTTAKRTSASLLFVKKTNSTTEAFFWRHEYDFYHTAGIDWQCLGVYRLAGYLPLPSAGLLHDLDVPSMTDVSSVPRFLA